MIPFICSFLAAYLLTNLIEFFPFNYFIKEPLKEKIWKLVLINSITLPIVWIVLPFFYSQYLIAFIVAEVLVVIAETFLIKILIGMKIRDSFKIAAVMNILSAVIGFFIPFLF